MNTFFGNVKVVAAATALGLAAVTGAQAAAITVGGVTWDPDAPNDFTSQSVNMRQFIDPITGILTGFGIVTVINGTDSTAFCFSGCELTFQFGGFTPTGGSIIPGVGQTINYTGGFIKFFADATPEILNPNDYSSLTFANTGDGVLWLDLVGNSAAPSAISFLGTALGDGASGFAGLSGIGRTDVTGAGAADEYFDYNTRPFGSDVTFSTSLTFFTPGTTAPLDVSGTGNLVSDSRVDVSEPSSLALLGVALLGLAGVRRLRK